MKLLLNIMHNQVDLVLIKLSKSIVVNNYNRFEISTLNVTMLINFE